MTDALFLGEKNRGKYQIFEFLLRASAESFSGGFDAKHECVVGWHGNEWGLREKIHHRQDTGHQRV
jgi:hypothetical protein